MVSTVFANSSDSNILTELWEKYGVFSERFFYRSIHERIVRKFSSADIDLQEFRAAISEAWGYDVGEQSATDAIYRIKEHLYEQNTLQKLKDQSANHLINAWFEQFREPRSCVLCGRTFRVIDLPDWVYFGSNGFSSCCFQCAILETPKKSELATLIPSFLEICGFIPGADANPINYSFTSRLAKNQWAKVVLAYAKMGGIDHVKKKFGSWFQGMAESGALPDGVLVTARGIRCLAQDGHLCHSLDEQYIDNWLSNKGLEHDREPLYPKHSTLNPTGRRRADWLVEETFIEYFGLIGDKNYEKKMDEKITLAQLLDIDLIALYPEDIRNLEKKLGHLLR